MVEIWGPGLLTTQRSLNTECKEMCEIEEEDEQRVWEPQNGVLKFISAIAQAESCIMKRIKRTNELITLVKGE